MLIMSFIILMLAIFIVAPWLVFYLCFIGLVYGVISILFYTVIGLFIALPHIPFIVFFLSGMFIGLVFN